MSCGQSQCPFFDLHAGTGTGSETETQCIVCDAIQKVTFAKGEILFLQGQPSTRLFSVTKGLVKICTHSSDGHEQIVGLSGPGKLLVGLQSLNDERYAYTAIALTAVQACEISDRALLDDAEKSSQIAMRIVDATNAHLAQSRALVEVMGHKFAAAKVASLIMLMTPKSQHGDCCWGGPLSRADMASLLGLSEETVCRLMADMKRAGAIETPRGRIKVRDWNQLEAFSEDHSGHDAAH
jgi:CRP/FNR family transcriptional regulator